MYSMDEDFPPADPGNQLRAKLNAVAGRSPPTLGEVLHTATERGIIPFKIDVEDAMTVVALYFVARDIANSSNPGEEVGRIRL